MTCECVPCRYCQGTGTILAMPDPADLEIGEEPCGWDENCRECCGDGIVLCDECREKIKDEGDAP